MTPHVVYKGVYEILYKICVTDSLHSKPLKTAGFTVIFEIPVQISYTFFFLDLLDRISTPFLYRSYVQALTGCKDVSKFEFCK